MGFSFSRLKQWLGYENVTNSDLNAEFNNLISRAGADTLSSANSTAGSTPNVTAMQTTANPGGVGTETLAQTLQTDVQQMRYVLNAIIGGTYWYSQPPATLSSLNTAAGSTFFFPSSRVSSGRVDANNQPMYLVPSGASTSFTLKATATNLVLYFNAAQQTFAADITTSVNTQAASKTCLVNDGTLASSQATKIQGERGTQITIDTVDAAITGLQGKYAAFKVSTEYFLAYVDTTNNRLAHCFRGVGFDSTDTFKAPVAIADNNVITLMRLTYVFATYNSTTPAVDKSDASTNNAPIVSGSQPASATSGDWWYDLVNNTWKKYNGASWVSQLACFVGIVISDNANAVVARSADFGNKAYSALNTVQLEYSSTAQVQTSQAGQHISVSGNAFFFEQALVAWNTATDMDSGEALSTNTTYFCYVKDTGGRAISTIAPKERFYDLYGEYHPAKPWRSVGTFTTDGSSNVLKAPTLTAAYTLESTDSLVMADTTSGGFTVTVPSAVLNKNQVFYIRNTGTANLLTLAAADNLDGQASYYVRAGESLTIGSTGSTWFIFGKSGKATLLSTSSGSYTTTNTALTDVTNLTITSSFNNKQHFIGLMADPAVTDSYVGAVDTTANGLFRSRLSVVKDGAQIGTGRMEIGGVTNGVDGYYPPGCVWILDTPSTGSHTYKIQTDQANADTISVIGVKLVIYEI